MSALRYFCPQYEPNSQAPPKAELLGMAAYLWSQSELHKDWSIEMLGQVVFPAVDRGSFVLALDEQDKPKGLVCYTFMGLEEELKFLRHLSYPLPSSWNSGPALWFLDWVAPTGDASLGMAHFMTHGPFAHDIGKALRVKRWSPHARLVYTRGSEVRALHFRAYRDAFEREIAKLPQATAHQRARGVA